MHKNLASRAMLAMKHPRRMHLQTLLLTVPVVVFVILGWHMRWIVDDGFIYLRVVEMVTSGHGPVFNIGERVEAFTGPLWLAILVLAELLIPLRLEWLAVTLGLGLSAAGIVMAISGAATLTRLYAPGAWLLPFGVLVPVGIAGAWLFATSGLESGLVTGWLGACMLLLARWAGSGQRLPLYGAVIIGLGWLVRPELALHSALFISLVIIMQWPRDTWGGRLTTLAAAAALPVAYQIFRMGYYGAIIANSAIAKDASRTQWDNGWAYLVDLISPYWLWLPLLLLVVGGYIPLILGLLRTANYRALVVTGAFVLVGLLHGTYITASGGDWMHARLLLPALYALVMPVAVIPIIRAHALAWLLVPWVVVSIFTLRPDNVVPWVPTSTPVSWDWPNHVLVEHRGWGDGVWQRRSWYEGEGFYYDRAFAMRFIRLELDDFSEYVRLPAAAIGGIGASGYGLGPGWQIIDLWGLAHHISGRMISTPTRYNQPRLPGHEKPLPNVWLIAIIAPEGVYPNPRTLPWRSNPLIPHSDGDEFRGQVASARQALTCPALRELLAAVSAPLTVQRFVDNFTGAWARTRLTIPPDPHEAREKFCG